MYLYMYEFRFVCNDDNCKNRSQEDYERQEGSKVEMREWTEKEWERGKGVGMMCYFNFNKSWRKSNNIQL